MIKKHKDNLLKLATYLESLPDDYDSFDMAYYNCEYGNEYDIHERKNSCGTVACAVGHGPNAGIRTYNDSNWNTYSKRVFGLDSSFFSPTNEAWNFLFGGYWSDYDNTVKGAADRIRTFLDLGCEAPEHWERERIRTFLDLGCEAPEHWERERAE